MAARAGTAMLVLTFLAAGLPAWAQTEEELPARVGRVAEVSGDIFLATADHASEWIPVGLNYPVTTGDNLWVGGEGRAEVDFGGGRFRMGADTNLHVSRLDDHQLALFVAQGRVIVRVRALDAGDAVLIDAPNSQIRVMRPGLYRIDVPPNGDTTSATVREGEAQILFAGGVQKALPGQTVLLVGAEPSFADVRYGGANDPFDLWSIGRDRYYEGAAVASYVPPDMVGYADLGHYGAWETYPEYGNVWFPADVGPDWTPYSNGYWTSVGGWGNTWVDYSPWGYAPFHYGRWVWFGRRWGWCPGGVAPRPIWAPALVAWYGGSGWGAAYGSGGPVYGWVPLGWRDPYRPWWRGCSEGCWTRYNRPYEVTISYADWRTRPAPRYSNANVPHAVTVVSGATLSARLPVLPNRVTVPPNAIATAPVLSAAPAVKVVPSGALAQRTAPRGLPAPASTLYPASRNAPAIGSEARKAPAPAQATLPARSSPGTQTPFAAPATRPPVSTTPAALAPGSSTPSGSQTQEFRGRAPPPAAGTPGTLPPGTTIAPNRPREPAAAGNPPPTKTPSPSAVVTEPPRSVAVPAPKSSVPAQAGTPMPPPRPALEPARSASVPVPQTAPPMPPRATPAPSAQVPATPAKTEAAPAKQKPKEPNAPAKE